jgi:hypothetical protein
MSTAASARASVGAAHASSTPVLDPIVMLAERNEAPDTRIMCASPPLIPVNARIWVLQVALGSVGSRELGEPIGEPRSVLGSLGLVCPRSLFGYVQHLEEALMLVRTNAEVAFATAAIIAPGRRGAA